MCRTCLRNLILLLDSFAVLVEDKVTAATRPAAEGDSDCVAIVPAAILLH